MITQDLKAKEKAPGAEREDRRGRFGKGGGRRGNFERAEKEFAQETVELARVTRVTKGGKRMRFRACVVLGDKKGRVGYGVAKGADVTLAISKAERKAKKSMIQVILENNTIPHRTEAKYKAAMILLKPAPEGTGVIAGGAARIVLSLAGIPNVVSKSLGSKNKINNVKATFEALGKLKARTRRVIKQ